MGETLIVKEYQAFINGGEKYAPNKLMTKWNSKSLMT